MIVWFSQKWGIRHSIIGFFCREINFPGDFPCEACIFVSAFYPTDCIIKFPSANSTFGVCVFTISLFTVIKTSFDKCSVDDNSYLIFQIFNPLNFQPNSPHKSIHKKPVKVTWVQQLCPYQLFALISQLLIQPVDKKSGIIAELFQKLFTLKLQARKWAAERYRKDIKYL